MFLGNLVQDLAHLREAAVLGLQSLQAEQHRLEGEIQKAQERHQTVRESQAPVRHHSGPPSQVRPGSGGWRPRVLWVTFPNQSNG